jgi:hypothetical protein
MRSPFITRNGMKNAMLDWGLSMTGPRIASQAKLKS